MSRKCKKAAVIGHFGFGENLLNGQTVKTKIVTAALEKEYSAEEVLKIDTHGGMKSYLKLPFQLFSALRKSKNVLIFPAHNGIRVIAPLLTVLNCFYRRALHYCVIGGWLPQLLQQKKRLKKCLKRFRGIYVETNTLKNALENMGFQNITVMPNCKDLTPLRAEELIPAINEPFALCTFSRVMKEKGMEEAVGAVKRINEEKGRTVYTLDIYGQVDGAQTAWFENLQKEFPHYVKYGGLVPFDKSVELIKNYFALLFPTKFYTEGIPGTVIDAYAAGVPVIASKWESFADLIEEGKTGFGYDFKDNEGLYNLLLRFAEHPEEINGRKADCLQAAKRFTSSEAIKLLNLD